MTTQDRLLDLLHRLINKGTQQQFNLLFHKYHEADIAEALQKLPSELKVLFFSRLKSNRSVDVFEEMDMDSQIEIIQSFKSEFAAGLIEKMDKDDGVDLLEALLDENQDKAKEILSKMDMDDQIELNKLLNYKEDSAGALMNTEFVSIPEKLYVKEALKNYIDKSPKESDAAFYLFIVNEFNQIKGVISIRKLLLANPDILVSEIRNSYPIKVNVNTDQEDVANLFQKYRSIVLPVVDDLDIILGVITIDDVVDVVVEEAYVDMLKLSGTSGDDIQNDKLIQGSIFYSLLHRMPWLFVTIIGGVIASTIMLHYAPKLTYEWISLSFILSFVPLLMGLGGNIGNQSATILVRALALSNLDRNEKIKIIVRELGIGGVIGLVIGLVVSGYVYIISQNVVMAFCIGVSIFVNMGFASVLGASLPIVLKSLKIDPAIASAPFISSTLDIIGQLIYFTTIILLFNWLV
ncbi:MAG: magnesium transporter [Candidatus Margulisiibacteriota bacterium]